MRQQLWIDPAMGMAGDMFAAALIGLGAPEEGMVAAMRTAGRTIGAVDVRVRPASLPDGTPARHLDVTVQEARPPLPIAYLTQALAATGVVGEYAAFASRALGILCAAERVAHGVVEADVPETGQVSLSVIGQAHTPYRHAAPCQPDEAAPQAEGAFYIELNPAYAMSRSFSSSVYRSIRETPLPDNFPVSTHALPCPETYTGFETSGQSRPVAVHRAG